MNCRWPWPHQIVSHLWGNRDLILQLTVRDLFHRYKGSFLGILWSFLTPLLLLLVYTFVFSQMFETRWGATREEGRVGFALMLFAGLIPYQLFSDSVSRAPGLVLGNPSFVKRILFPLEVLPVVVVNCALIHSLVGLAILLLGSVATQGRLPLTVLLLPVVLIPVLLLALASAWLLASVGVFVRDIGQAVSVALTLLLFLTPVVYPLSAIPTAMQFWVRLNPLTVLIESYRQIVLLGQAPRWGALAVVYGLSGGLAYLSFVWFQRSKPAFSDVL